MPAGQIPTYSLNGTAIVGNTFTLPANDATVAVTLVSLWSGNGTQGDPYLITTTSGLDLLATKVNNGNDFGGFYFKLGNDIEYDPTALDDNGENYTAIGVFDSQLKLKFSGTFDGDGHTISGIRINRPTDPNTVINSHTLQGLFGYLEGGTIKNVTVSDASITGCALVGAIVGVNNGTIENCQVAGAVSVTGANNGNGGIVGQNYGTIENCQVTGTVSVSGTNNGRGVGGIVGQNYGTTKNCYVNGTVNVTSKRYVGGIAGENQGTIENCLVLGTSVMATNNRGSIVGYNNTNNQTYTCILSHNYYHDCTVNGATTNVGTGDGDVIADDGAVQAVIRMVEGYGESTESDHWTFISSPLSSNTSATNVVNLINTTTPENYDFYRLNNTTWENIKATSSTNHSDFTTLVNGQGYLYANKDNVGLVFKGTYNSGTTQDVALQQGYNLVGNPFADSAYINTPFYKMNAAGTGIEAVSEYWNNKIAVCTGVVVNAQASGNVTFSKTAPLHSTGNNGSLQIALAQTVTTRGGSSTETLDNAIVSFNEGSQLGKFYFGEQDANIYIPQDGKDYAIVSAEARSEIPVCFKAHKNGEYTITVNCKDVIARSAATKQSIHLIDNLTGADVDLLTTPTYTFTARNDDYPSRFKLVFSNGNQNDNESEDFAFISNGNLIVNGTGTLQIIDALGRTLFTKELSTFNSSLFTFNFTPGVYVLRLINGEKVKTQKIIVD